MNLLFLNVGKRCQLVECFRSALQLRGGGVIYGSDIDPLAPALQLVDYPQIFPFGDDPGFPDVFIDFCKSKSIDLVIPTIDPDLFRLDKLRGMIEKEVPSCRLLLSPDYTLKHARDKRLSKKLFAELGAEVPESVDTSHDKTIDFPVFVKPHDGSAGVGAGVVNDSETLLCRLKENPELIVEKVVEGPEYTVDVLCDFSGAALFAVPRKRIKVRSGEVVQGLVIRNPDLEKSAMRIAEGFKAVGPVTVQFRQASQNRFVAIEVNARVGGGLPLAIAAGADWPGWILDLCRGIAPNVNPDMIDHLVMTRCDRSFFVKQEEVARIVSNSKLPYRSQGDVRSLLEVKAWVFDLDDTLYPEKDFVFSGYRGVAEKVFSDFGIDIEGFLRARFNRGERGDLFSKTLGQIGVIFDENYIQELVTVYRERMPNILPYVDVIPTLEKLREKQFKIGLISDGWLAVQRNKLEALGIEKYFDSVVFTDDICGIASWKPAADGFQRCLHELSLTAAEAVYVGDNPGKDFSGARAVGMKTIRIHRIGSEHGEKIPIGPDYEPDLSFSSFREISEMLDSNSK